MLIKLWRCWDLPSLIIANVFTLKINDKSKVVKPPKIQQNNDKDELIVFEDQKTWILVIFLDSWNCIWPWNFFNKNFILIFLQRPILAVSDGAFRKFLLQNVPTLESKFWPTIWCVESRAQTVFASILRSKIFPTIHYRR